MIIVQISNDTERFVASETSHPSKHLVSNLQQFLELSAKFVALSLSHNGKTFLRKVSVSALSSSKSHQLEQHIPPKPYQNSSTTLRQRNKQSEDRTKQKQNDPLLKAEYSMSEYRQQET